MANYIVRVELRGSPSAGVYTKLHAVMESVGFLTTIPGAQDGRSLIVGLPNAVYAGSSHLAAAAVSDRIKGVVEDQVWTACIVLAIEWLDWGQTIT